MKLKIGTGKRPQAWRGRKWWKFWDSLDCGDDDVDTGDGDYTISYDRLG